MILENKKLKAPINFRVIRTINFVDGEDFCVLSQDLVLVKSWKCGFSLNWIDWYKFGKLSGIVGIVLEIKNR